VLGAVASLPAVEPSPAFRSRVREAFVRAHPEYIERPAPRRVTWWEAVRAQFSFMPSWSVSLAIHVLLLSVAAGLFFAPREDRAGEISIAVPETRRNPAFVEDPRPREVVPEDRPDVIRPPGIGKAENLGDWRGTKVGRPFAALAAGRGAGKPALDAREGGAGTEAPVANALAWLASRQAADGRWPAAALGGLAEYETGVTGLAVLAFLADGHTHRSGAHALAVARGVEWLTGRQAADGRIGPEGPHAMYNHAVAALALTECWMLTGDEDLKFSASAAVAYAQDAQNARGGWDYTRTGPETDTSVGAWVTHLLRTAREAGIDGVAPGLIRARDRVLELTDAEGRVGYRKPGQQPNGPYALTAAGAWAYMMASAAPERAQLDKYRDVILEGSENAAFGDGDRRSNDLYFGYFGSLALHQMGGEAWSRWFGRVKTALVRSQQADGSWAADLDKWGGHGGQAYTTAIAALTLQTPHRYPRFVR
jgi:hypothetical protein